MSFKILLSENFKKEAKRLIKKYPSLKVEIAELGEQLKENPTTGTALGKSVFKIRLAVKSKGKGKKGGARVLSLARIVKQAIILFSIYDKSEKESISDEEIKKLLEQL